MINKQQINAKLEIIYSDDGKCYGDLYKVEGRMQTECCFFYDENDLDNWCSLFNEEIEDGMLPECKAMVERYNKDVTNVEDFRDKTKEHERDDWEYIMVRRDQIKWMEEKLGKNMYGFDLKKEEDIE